MSTPAPRGTYRRIAESLRGRPPGVVHEAALMEEFGVSRTTVRRALAELARWGVAISEPGVGWRLNGAAPASLADRIAAVITADGLGPGDVFPSEAVLCERFGVSRPTLRRALAVLEGRGVLVARPGRGRFLPDCAS